MVLGGTLRYLDTDMRLVGQWKPGTEQQPVEEFHSDDRLLSLADQALAAMGVTHIIGIIASGNYFVDTPAQIAKVIHDTGADAVEMEGASVAHVAARNEVPALVIRALSDTPTPTTRSSRASISPNTRIPRPASCSTSCGACDAGRGSLRRAAPRKDTAS